MRMMLVLVMWTFDLRFSERVGLIGLGIWNGLWIYYMVETYMMESL